MTNGHTRWHWVCTCTPRRVQSTRRLRCPRCDLEQPGLEGKTEVCEYCSQAIRKRSRGAHQRSRTCAAHQASKAARDAGLAPLLPGLAREICERAGIATQWIVDRFEPRGWGRSKKTGHRYVITWAAEVSNWLTAWPLMWSMSARDRGQLDVQKCAAALRAMSEDEQLRVQVLTAVRLSVSVEDVWRVCFDERPPMTVRT